MNYDKNFFEQNRSKWKSGKFKLHQKRPSDNVKAWFRNIILLASRICFMWYLTDHEVMVCEYEAYYVVCRHSVGYITWDFGSLMCVSASNEHFWNVSRVQNNLHTTDSEYWLNFCLPLAICQKLDPLCPLSLSCMTEDKKSINLNMH